MCVTGNRGTRKNDGTRMDLVSVGIKAGRGGGGIKRNSYIRAPPPRRGGSVRASGWFDMGLHIIKPAPVFMARAIHRGRCAPIHSSFPYPARHRGIKFGNSIPRARACARATCRSLSRGLARCASRGSNLLRFISASKLMAETLPLQFRAEHVPLARPPRAELSAAGAGSYFCLQSRANP